MGGEPAGPIDLAGHASLPWHKLITAILGAVRERGLSTIDETRRSIEDLPPEIYDSGYFERWMEAAVNLLEEKGLVTRAEVVARAQALRAGREAAQ